MNLMGDIVVSLEDEPWTYLAAEVELDQIHEASTPLPWKRDRRPELYGIVTA